MPRCSTAPKEHDINKDKWIGVGGHAEGTEGPEDCLLREVKEETGLTLTSYQFRGLITFISDEAPEPEEMCLFTADGFTGELIECNEGDLQWMDKKEVLEASRPVTSRIVSFDPVLVTIPVKCSCPAMRNCNFRIAHINRCLPADIITVI